MNTDRQLTHPKPSVEERQQPASLTPVKLPPDHTESQPWWYEPLSIEKGKVSGNAISVLLYKLIQWLGVISLVFLMLHHGTDAGWLVALGKLLKNLLGL